MKKKLSRPLSHTEGFIMISDYFRSGMCCSEYYRSHGVSEWQFYKWKKLYLQEHPRLNSTEKAFYTEETPSFACLEIKGAPIASSPHSLPAMEIQYPNGIRLCIAEGLKEASCLAGLLTLSTVSSCSR